MKVKIRDWYELEREFGLDEDGDIDCYYSFTKDMGEYCGKIIEIDRDKVGKTNLFKYDGWYFNKETYEIFKDVENGDMKIRIREWEDMEREFGLDEYGDIDCYYNFIKGMKKYCGKIIEIDEVTFIKDAFIYDNWIFTDDMYEVIEE